MSNKKLAYTVLAVELATGAVLKMGAMTEVEYATAQNAVRALRAKERRATASKTEAKAAKSAKVAKKPAGGAQRFAKGKPVKAKVEAKPAKEPSGFKAE